MKMVTFTGIERCDFAYYTARLLATQAPNVIVIDNSKRHELFNSMREDVYDDDDDEIITRSGIVYLKDIAYSPDFYNSFDYVVVYDGSRPREEDVKNATLVFAMPDYRPKTMELMKGLPDNTEFIMRDAAGKVNEKTAAIVMDVDEDRVVGSLSVSDIDYSCYLSLIYNGRQKIGGLTNEYCEALAYVCGRILDMDDKQAMKMVKRERKS